MKRRTVKSIASVALVLPMLAGCSLIGGGENKNTDPASHSEVKNAQKPTLQPQDPQQQASAQPASCGIDDAPQIDNFDAMLTPELLQAFSREDYLNALCSAVEYQISSSAQQTTIAKRAHSSADFAWMQPFFTQRGWDNVSKVITQYEASPAELQDVSKWADLNVIAPFDLGDKPTNTMNDQIHSGLIKTEVKSMMVGITEDKQHILAFVDTSSIIPLYDTATKKVDIEQMDRSVRYVMVDNPANGETKVASLIDDYSGNVNTKSLGTKTVEEVLKKK